MLNSIIIYSENYLNLSGNRTRVAGIRVRRSFHQTSTRAHGKTIFDPLKQLFDELKHFEKFQNEKTVPEIDACWPPGRNLINNFIGNDFSSGSVKITSWCSATRYPKGWVPSSPSSSAATPGRQTCIKKLDEPRLGALAQSLKRDSRFGLLKGRNLVTVTIR